MSDAAPPIAAAAPVRASAWAGARAWHAGWALGQTALLAAVLLVCGQAGLGVSVALAVAAAPGVLGAAVLGGDSGGARGAAMAGVWTACLAAAAAWAGGPASSLAPELLAPAAAALALGLGARPAALACALAAAGAGVLAALLARAGSPLGAGADAWLGWGCAAVTAASLVSAWGARATPRAAAHAPPLAAAVAPAEAAPDPALAAAEQARDEAVRERDDARESAAARTRFLAHMSHELRTPLNAVIGFSDIMRTRLFGPLPERYGEYAGLIHESGEHLLAVINDVLDLAKTEAGRYELRREVFDARDALSAALRLTRVQADEAGIDLRATPAQGPVTVDADARALKQMALNLISNALKFTPRGGHVTAGVAAVGGELQLTVADTGVGIRAEDLERLGRPFEQAKGSQERQGTGLGLSLVRAFAQLHDGEMRIESRLGAGTAVTVRMPVLAPEAEAVA